MTSARSTCLADSNLLVYVYDSRDLLKQQQAMAVTRQLVEAGVGIVSTQVLGEFFNTVTRKLPNPLTVPQAEQEIRNITSAWHVVDVTLAVVLEALYGVQRYQFAYWDALIWGAARLNGAPYILSEDFNDGADLGGVRILNPFAPHFSLAQVL
jgi:predicted nucleic acid-binding protein